MSPTTEKNFTPPARHATREDRRAIASDEDGGKAPNNVPIPALLLAARRILSDPVEDPSDDPNWVAKADELASLTLAVQARAASGKTSAPPGSATPLRRSLVAKLEREVAKDRSEDVDSPAIRGIVVALGEMRQSLEAPVESSDDTDELLSGPQVLELVSEIAHDLRSPLTSILTLAETLRRGQSGDVNDVQRRQLGLIYSAALALSTTASDFLELAHGGDRLAQKEPTPFSIAEILESVRDITYPMAEEKGLELRLENHICDRRLGYPLALSRVLLNLTVNALKFTEEGFVEVRVEVTEGIEVEFSVRDSGRGIEPEALKTLFQPFRRASVNRPHFSGTGLGLAICRRLVEAMGSELKLETRPGWGTRFFFRLDMRCADSLT